MNVDFNNKTPIYHQIIDAIKNDIVVGKLKGGDKLPSVRSLSSQLKVNPNTIQRAYQELEREELTYTQRGMGSYVTENKDLILKLRKIKAENILNNFINGMKDLGFSKDKIITILKEELNKEVL